MYIFSRTRTGTTEVFEVIIPEETLPDGTSRFGNPVGFNHRDKRYFEIGTLILIHDDDETEYLLATKAGLTENEYLQLDRELELLVGREVRCTGSDRIQGWFEHDSLRSTSAYIVSPRK